MLDCSAMVVVAEISERYEVSDTGADVGADTEP